MLVGSVPKADARIFTRAAAGSGRISPFIVRSPGRLARSGRSVRLAGIAKNFEDSRPLRRITGRRKLPCRARVDGRGVPLWLVVTGANRHDTSQWEVVLDARNERMKKMNPTKSALTQWERSFRADAQADHYQIFQAHLRSLDLPEDASLLLDGTIVFVQMCVAYLSLDGQEFVEFLEQQKYDPRKACNAPYQVTFDLHRKAYARINLTASLRPVDLADLYGAPWDDYRVVGYCDLWISRIDEVPLSPDEIEKFEMVVDEDLRFDYSEDELSFWFDPDTHEGVLKVSVQDVYGDEESDDGDDSDEGTQEDKINDKQE